MVKKQLLTILLLFTSAIGFGENPTHEAGEGAEKLTLLCSTLFSGEGHIAHRGYVAKLPRAPSEMPRTAFVDSGGDFRIDSVLVNYLDLFRLDIHFPKIDLDDHVTADLPLENKDFYHRKFSGDFGVRQWWTPVDTGEFKANALEIRCMLY